MKKLLVIIFILVSVEAFAAENKETNHKIAYNSNTKELQKDNNTSSDIATNQNGISKDDNSTNKLSENSNGKINANTWNSDNLTQNVKTDNKTVKKDNSTNEIPFTPKKLTDNPGYMRSHGMIGIYGFLPDFHSKTMQDNNIGGGGFIYANLTNMFWGNFMIGVNSDYVFTKATRNQYTANMKLNPVTLDFAFMTSSDTVNVWGGIGASYTFANTDIRDIKGVGGGFNKKTYTNFLAGDFFVGGEYIFTENPKYRFGAFFEFRYTFTQPVHIKADAANVNIDDTLTLQRLRYSIGLTYHF